MVLKIFLMLRFKSTSLPVAVGGNMGEICGTIKLKPGKAGWLTQ
jgi:hypothetical protein